MSSSTLTKSQLIEQIIRLQDDFQVLTDRSNSLQHENEYFQAQLEDLQAKVQELRAQASQLAPYSQQLEHQEPQWPLYIRVENDNLPQHPGEYVKFLGQDGRLYVQNVQLFQYTEASPDGKSQQIVREEWFVVQQPLEVFEQVHGAFQQFGSGVGPGGEDKKEEKVEERQNKVKQMEQKSSDKK